MLSPFSFPVALLLLHLAHAVLSTSTSAVNSPSQAASPSYANITSSSSPNATPSGDLAAATTALFDFVSGSAAVESCLQEWESWWVTNTEELIGGAAPSNYPPSFFTTLSYVITSTVYSTYTLCDGIPRIVLDGPLNYTLVTETLAFFTHAVEYTYESVLPPSPIVVSTFLSTSLELSQVGTLPPAAATSTFDDNPEPTCQIGPSDCSSLYAASSNAMFTGGGINTTVSPPIFACEYAFDAGITTAITDTNPNPCFVSVPVVQLIYWPVTLASQDLCVYPDPIDITATQSNTLIASMFGRNFTSDENCYISYPIAYASFGNGTVQTEPGDIVAVASSNLQSLRGSQVFADWYTYSFNFADLPPNHVPVLAYEGGADCSMAVYYDWLSLYPYCATICEALYTPQLSFPTELKAKYPQWATCDFNLFGLYDPPTSLIAVDFLTPPSTSTPTTAALPAGNGNGNPITPSQTAVSVTYAPSSTVAGPPGSPATAIDSSINGGDYGTGSETNGDSNIDSDSLTNTDPAQGTVVTFGTGSVVISVNDIDGVVIGSTTLSPGQVATIDGQIVSVMSQDPGVVVLPTASAPVTAVFTLGDGNAVTATSIAGVNGFIVGSQTLTAGQAFTTDGVVVSVVAAGLLVSSEASSEPSETNGAIITLNSETLTALESVNNQGATIIDLGPNSEITIGGPAITLSGGAVLSAGSSGLVISGTRGITTISYSTITMTTSTSAESSTLSPFMTTMAVTSTSKKGGSSRVGIGMGVHVIWILFAVLGLL